MAVPYMLVTSLASEVATLAMAEVAVPKALVMSEANDPTADVRS